LIDPLIVHFPSIEAAEKHVEFNEKARELAATFWPGALTMVLPKKASISDLITADLPSVAIRVPGHPAFHSLLERLEFPLAAPSANPFGYVSPTLPEHVQRTLGNRIAAVLDGGPCQHGVESTIVDLREPESPKILRPGPISAEELGIPSESGKPTSDGGAQAAPGMLTQHYSPNTPITLFRHGGQPVKVNEQAAVIYTSKPEAIESSRIFWLSETGAEKEIAHNLFMLIQKLDQKNYERIHIELADESGVGVAVNDRLRRAAAKRS
jgi:L-threonylcarbamoyladenylate synthase